MQSFKARSNNLIVVKLKPRSL